MGVKFVLDGRKQREKKGAFLQDKTTGVLGGKIQRERREVKPVITYQCPPMSNPVEYGFE